MEKANAAQVLSGFLWKDGVLDEIKKSVSFCGDKKEINQTIILPVLMDFQEFLFKGQPDESSVTAPVSSVSEGGWIAVEDGLPQEGKRVLIRYTPYKFPLTDIAMYTYGGKHEFEDENEDFPECLDEEKGVSFLPEGFWFNSEVDENLFQRIAVTHWQPLPAPPTK